MAIAYDRRYGDLDTLDMIATCARHQSAREVPIRVPEMRAGRRSYVWCALGAIVGIVVAAWEWARP